MSRKSSFLTFKIRNMTERQYRQEMKETFSLLHRGMNDFQLFELAYLVNVAIEERQKELKSVGINKRDWRMKVP